MNKIGVVYASYDGILNSYSGIGTATRTFIESFAVTRSFFQERGVCLDLHLITPALLSKSLGYDRKLLEDSRGKAETCGGTVHFVINGSDGMVPYGNIDNWKVVSIASANKVLEIARDYDKTIVFCVDTPFAHVPYYIELQKQAFSVSDIVSVLVFHSDALIHENNPSIERLTWENSAIKLGCLKSNVKIAKTSKFLTSHLRQAYDVPENKLIDLQTGLCPTSERYFPIGENVIKQKLQEYGIPLNRNLIFSVGRAVEYKGFDILIKAMTNIKRQAHLVFIASPYKTEPSFVSELQDLLGRVKISCTPIFNLDFELPQLICQWRNTKIVAQLSRREPFGLVPEEVRLWARKGGPVVLVSSRDGHIEQVNNGEDGFLVDVESTPRIAKKIDYILGLNSTQLDKIRNKGFKRVVEDYDFRISLFRCLNALIGGQNNTEQIFRKKIEVYDSIF